MPKAIEALTTTAGRAAPASLPSGHAVDPASVDCADSELLAACARFEALENEIAQLHPIADVVRSTPASTEAEEAMEDLRQEQEALGDEIAAMVPRTPEGLRANAAAIVSFWGGPMGRHQNDLSYVRERMEWSLLLAVAGLV